MGWLVVSLSAVIGVYLVAPDGGRPADTLAALGLAHTIGMSAAAVALLLALARALPGSVTVGMVRTVTVGVISAGLGALAGRWATDLVLDLTGSSLLAAVMAGGLGAILAASVVAGAVLVADRGILGTLRRTRA